jgi:hypothetical protein
MFDTMASAAFDREDIKPARGYIISTPAICKQDTNREGIPMAKNLLT